MRISRPASATHRTPPVASRASGVATGRTLEHVSSIEHLYAQEPPGVLLADGPHARGGGAGAGAPDGFQPQRPSAPPTPGQIDLVASWMGLGGGEPRPGAASSTKCASFVRPSSSAGALVVVRPPMMGEPSANEAAWPEGQGY